MSDFGNPFSVLVAMPALVLAAAAATRIELASFASRALVVYVSLLTVAFGSLFAASAGNPLIVIVALGFGFFANIAEGAFSFGLSAFGLAVLLVLGMTQPLPFSAWGPALGLAASLAGLVTVLRPRGLPRP
ncbi:MAG: hypothetical protein KF723_12255 [Rhizobiaceae bacterium]|nr:hypothetical protein [Rhizobiaceae bacterium]